MGAAGRRCCQQSAWRLGRLRGCRQRREQRRGKALSKPHGCHTCVRLVAKRCGLSMQRQMGAQKHALLVTQQDRAHTRGHATQATGSATRAGLRAVVGRAARAARALRSAAERLPVAARLQTLLAPHQRLLRHPSLRVPACHCACLAGLCNSTRPTLYLLFDAACAADLALSSHRRAHRPGIRRRTRDQDACAVRDSALGPQGAHQETAPSRWRTPASREELSASARCCTASAVAVRAGGWSLSGLSSCKNCDSVSALKWMVHETELERRTVAHWSMSYAPTAKANEAHHCGGVGNLAASACNPAAARREQRRRQRRQVLERGAREVVAADVVAARGHREIACWHRAALHRPESQISTLIGAASLTMRPPRHRPPPRPCARR